MPCDLEDLHALEHSLWEQNARFDKARMDALFAPDFQEVGRSGRRYSRQEMLFDESQSAPIPAILHDIQIRPLSADLAQVIYISELRYNPTLWAWRSSLWDRSTGNWKLRFHQGTPTEARPPLATTEADTSCSRAIDMPLTKEPSHDP